MQRVGIRENAGLILRLAIINGFVGFMAGMERTVLPLIGEHRFGNSSISVSLSFIIGFGISKAIMNLLVGPLSDRTGRKQALLMGWIVGIFVPVLLYFASEWWVVILANVLLGMNQGLAWSMTLNMKIDLAKPTERGLAIGINQFFGYSGLSIAAALTGFSAFDFSQTTAFYTGLTIAIMGLLLSLTVIDTHPTAGKRPFFSIQNLFQKGIFKDPTLTICSLAGMMTNLKDGMAWGLFPYFFTHRGLSLGETGLLIALYPASWGFFQLFTGALSDRSGRKPWIVGGMGVQALALLWMVGNTHFGIWIITSVLLGFGTAMAYPTLQAAVSDRSEPEWRATAMGLYRFWRDSGYVFGALLSGFLADWLGATWAIGLLASLPALTGVFLWIKLKETHPPSSALLPKP